MRPVRDSSTSSNASPVHPGLRQNASSRGKNTVAQAVHRLPSSAGRPSVVNHPSTAGAAVALGMVLLSSGEFLTHRQRSLPSVPQRGFEGELRPVLGKRIAKPRSRGFE